LFLHGNFRQAVLEAFIHVIANVKERTELEHKSADDLMNRAFSPKDGPPPVRFNALSTSEERDERIGIWFLFEGVVGMRNYKAHLITQLDDPQRAHEYLALASLLMRLRIWRVPANHSADSGKVLQNPQPPRNRSTAAARSASTCERNTPVMAFIPTSTGNHEFLARLRKHG